MTYKEQPAYDPEDGVGQDRDRRRQAGEPEGMQGSRMAERLPYRGDAMLEGTPEHQTERQQDQERQVAKSHASECQSTGHAALPIDQVH